MTRQKDLVKRQVLCVIGNRYVVFGHELSMNGNIMFDPERDSSVLPRVPDESEFPPDRLVQSLRIYGMEQPMALGQADFAEDLVLKDRDGMSIFIDVKVRSHSPKLRDVKAGYEKVRLGNDEGKNIEVWHFDTERLNLSILTYDGNMPIHCELVPLDVWEKTDSGIFRRESVVAEVARWEKCVSELYKSVTNWYGKIPGVTFESSRTVRMSEEMMQKFAVCDRELPILDVVSGKQVLASFVPRGLWLIGAWGRIDIITPTQTRVLIMLRDENEDLEWRLVSLDNRLEAHPLAQEVMLQLLEVA